MQNKYVLEIDNINLSLSQINVLLNIQSYDNFPWKTKLEIHSNTFSFSVIENENDEYFNYINIFLDIIDHCKDKLDDAGITKSNITIWRYFKYFEQCNMEFNPLEMKRLGESGISLCVSCIDMSGDKYIHLGDINALKEDWF